MHPIICKIGPITFYSYGLALVAAFMLASWLAAKEAKKRAINADIILNLLFICFISGIIGARLFFVLENLGYYLKFPFEIIMLNKGGLSWFGGLAAGALAGIIFLKKNRIALFKALDLVVPFVALAHAIGRIGCLLNGCCYGEGFFSIPIQIYSSLLLLLIFFILRFLQSVQLKSGTIFYAYLMLYSLKRFFVEFAREEHARVIFSLTFFQLLSCALFAISLIALLKLRKSP